MKWFVLAPGPSMSRQLADRVRGENVIAVANAYELAPWAHSLVANDSRWWKLHPEAMKFAGRKFSANRLDEPIERVNPNTFDTSSNSGLLALDLARNYGATLIVMLGFDMHGTHFFGPYKNGCANTPDRRRQEFIGQFRDWAMRKENKAVRVVNCTPGSRITCFKFGDVGDFIGTSDQGRGGTTAQAAAVA